MTHSTCGNYLANYALYTPLGVLSMPGELCLVCGGPSRGSDNSGSVSNDLTFASASEDTASGQQADLDAKELLDNAVSAFGQKFTTVVVAYVMDDAEGSVTRLVSMNSDSMQRWGPAVSKLLEPTDVWVPSQGPGLHGEQNLTRYITDNALNVLGLGASRNICEMCWSELTNTLSIDLIGTPNKTGWIPPWMWLS